MAYKETCLRDAHPLENLDLANYQTIVSISKRKAKKQSGVSQFYKKNGTHYE